MAPPHPSLRHQFLATVVPRIRGGRNAPDWEQRRRENAGRDRRLPIRAVPGLHRHFEHQVRMAGHGRTQFPVHVLEPLDQPAVRTLFHVHGGGYVKPIDPFHVRWATRLARRTGARVVLPDHPLGPEFTWSDSHDEMASELRRWIEDEPGTVTLSGDSAGGGYALALAQTLRDAGAMLPGHLLLVSPWLDLTCSTPGTEEVAGRDPWLTLETLHAWARWWGGEGADLTRPELSPLFGHLDGLPRTLLQVGTRDLLAPSARDLAERARAARWDLTVAEEPDAVHVYPLLPGIPEARVAMEQAVYFLKS